MSISAEEELAKIKADKAWQKYLMEDTKSGRDATKFNLWCATTLALMFALFIVFIINDIDLRKLEYGIVLYALMLFGFVTYNLALIKQKLSFFFYIDDEARISESVYTHDSLKSRFSKEEIIEKLKAEDKNSIESLSSGAVWSSGIGLFSLFSALDVLKPLWMGGRSSFSSSDYFHMYGQGTFFVLILALCVYSALKQSSDLRKLTKSLRVFK